MQNIYSFLESMATNSAQELHLEPNKMPYILSAAGQTTISSNELQGPQISLMVFPIIPNDVKQELPDKSEVEFNYNNKFGNFKFNVKKSPSGFNVVIKALSFNTEPTGGFSQAQNFASQPQISTENQGNENQSPFQRTEPKPFPIPQISLNEVIEPEIQVQQPVFSINSEAPNSFSSKSEESLPFSNTQTFNYQNTVQEIVEPINKPTQNSSFDSLDSFNDTFLGQTNSPFQNQSIEIIEDYVEPAYEPAKPQNTFEPVKPQNTFEPAKVNSAAQKRIDDLFYKMAEVGASDLHLSVSMPPLVRKDGKIKPLESNEQTLTASSIKELLTSIMPEKNKEEFEARHDTDFAYEIKGLARFRANIFMDRKGMGGVFRIIPSKILTAEDLKLSQAILGLTELSKGLVVVTGPTGSGKSTTLCAMVDHINRNREDHLITIEDPIEFVHDNKKCLVNQREVHNHTDTFKDALRAALREDPDILLVGEMRDLETISIAIETAETGHLVFGTLHTTTAASTVDRIIDQFPADRQQQIRVMLSESLRGVIAQTLLPKKGGGRVAALEILIVTPAISNLIREGKTFQIPSAMQTGKQLGMVLLNDALIDLVKQGLVEPKDAYIKAVDKTGFEMALTRNGLKM